MAPMPKLRAIDSKTPWVAIAVVLAGMTTLAAIMRGVVPAHLQTPLHVMSYVAIWGGGIWLFKRLRLA